MNTNHQSPISGHDEINLLDYWCVIKKHRKMIAGILAVTSVAAVFFSLLLPKSYKAEALIIPVSAKGGGGGLSALASQFGSLASLAGVNLPGGASDSDKMMAILKSRTLTENVINRENLMPILFKDAWDVNARKWKSVDPSKQPNMELAVAAMKTLTSTMDDKKNKTIKISAEFRDPQVAARVVNAYIDELQKFISANAFTMAKRNRIFIEEQLEQNKEEFLEAGKEINEFYSGKKISIAESKVDVPIASTSEPGVDQGTPINDSEAMSEESQTSAADSKLRNPVIGVAEASSPQADPEVVSLLTQKEDIEKRIAEARTVKNVPQQVYLSYLMLRRELLGKVNALLTSQYEMSKIEESKEELSFQVIDKAVPPIYKFKPKRGQICIMSFMAALFGAIFIAFFREYIDKMRQMTSDQ